MPGPPIPRRRPRPRRETVEIYRVGDLPAVLATLLPAALHTLAAAELAGKQYDKTQTHKSEKYVDLPDPRLTDLKHKKRHKVISVTEEVHVQTQLDGPADIRIPALPYLAGYAKDGPGVILLGVDARLPVRGHVQCKLPDLAGASTGFRTAVELSAVAEVGVHRDGGDVKLSPPAVLDLRVTVSRLDLSNDVLESVRRRIREAINRELRHNEGRFASRPTTPWKRRCPRARSASRCSATSCGDASTQNSPRRAKVAWSWGSWTGTPS